VVRRSDGSGTTYIFSDFLSKVSPEWKEKIGVSTAPMTSLQGTTGAKGSEGMTSQVKLSAGSIGYVEMTYALQSNLKFGSVKNQEAEFITGSLEGVTTAAKNRLNDLPEDLGWSLTNAPGKGSYPLAGMVFAVIYQKQPAGNGAKVVDFLRWVTREDGGQKYAK